MKPLDPKRRLHQALRRMGAAMDIVWPKTVCSNERTWRTLGHLHREAEGDARRPHRLGKFETNTALPA